MKDVVKAIENAGVLPVINITSEDLAEPLAKALIDGGLPLIEVTLRSDCSLNAIKIIKEKFPQMTIGAGTVLTKEYVDKALSAGADYIVSPGYDPELVEYCNQLNVPITPGCSTASEIQDAIKKGVKIIKFFPAELSGGLVALKLLSGPFPNVKFLPTGGITFDNLGSYLGFDKIIACGGSFMAPAAILKNKEFDKITAFCKKAVQISLNFKLAHVGVNHTDADGAYSAAQAISDIFDFAVRKCSSSTFSGTAVECMNNERFGEKGHIGFSTNSMVRAMAYLSSKGIEFDESSIKRDSAGNITCIYLKEQISGFALHIVKN